MALEYDVHNAGTSMYVAPGGASQSLSLEYTTPGGAHQVASHAAAADGHRDDASFSRGVSLAQGKAGAAICA